MCSFSENEVENHSQSDGGKGFVNMTRRHIIRTYPGAQRIASGNYNPMDGIILGAQMVALNFQTRNAPFEIYRGFFRDNGDSGFIRKPTFLTASEDGLFQIQSL